MNRIGRAFNAIGGTLMARSGRIGILGTTGAKTGQPRRAPVGFVSRADGSILVGAGSPKARGWTANLRANPAATFSIKGVERRYRARLVPADQREPVIAELRAGMGSTVRGITWGDVFVLEPEE